VVDIPPAAAEVTEHLLHRVVCPCCKTTTAAKLPDDVSRRSVGPRLQAVLAVLVGRYRLSRREAADAMEALFGPKARVALATVSALEQETSAALEPAWQQAHAAVRSASVAHADETSFDPCWLWLACTDEVSCFRLDRRTKEAFRRLVPKDFSGVLVTDRYGSYDGHPPRKRQFCWPHLKRNFRGLVDRGRTTAPVGHAGLRACKNVFKAFHDHQKGRLSLGGMRHRLASTRQTLQASLERYRNHPDEKARGLCRHLLEHFPSLWTFTRVEGVAPSNNRAEQEVRPAVLWRKGSFGCRSERGKRFVERMLTVTRTLRHQGQGVLDFVESALRAARGGGAAPLLVTG